MGRGSRRGSERSNRVRREARSLRGQEEEGVAGGKGRRSGQVRGKEGVPAGAAAKATGQRERASRAAAAGASPRGSPRAGLPFLVPLGPASPAPAPTHSPAPPRGESGGKTLPQGGTFGTGGAHRLPAPEPRRPPLGPGHPAAGPLLAGARSPRVGRPLHPGRAISAQRRAAPDGRDRAGGGDPAEP